MLFAFARGKGCSCFGSYKHTHRDIAHTGTNKGLFISLSVMLECDAGESGGKEEGSGCVRDETEREVAINPPYLVY